MKKILIFMSVVSVVLMGCTAARSTTPAEPTRLTVFAANSLADAFTEIGKAYEAVNPGTTVTFNFAGSQTLRTQIEEGAQADVFASANNKEMDALSAGGLVASDAPQAFLQNKLVVILPAANPSGVTQLQDLATPGLKLVLAAEEVPVGNYARQSLEKMNGLFGTDFSKRVLAAVVSNEENVKQVVAKVQLGEADAGIVYASDAVAAADLKTIEIPPEVNVVASYPITPLIASAHSDEAADFVEYVLSRERAGNTWEMGVRRAGRMTA